MPSRYRVMNLHFEMLTQKTTKLHMNLFVKVQHSKVTNRRDYNGMCPKSIASKRIGLQSPKKKKNWILNLIVIQLVPR